MAAQYNEIHRVLSMPCGAVARTMQPLCAAVSDVTCTVVSARRTSARSVARHRAATVSHTVATERGITAAGEGAAARSGCAGRDSGRQAARRQTASMPPIAFSRRIPNHSVERPLVHLTVVPWAMRGGIVIGALLGMLAIVMIGRWLLIGGDDGPVRKY